MQERLHTETARHTETGLSARHNPGASGQRREPGRGCVSSSKNLVTGALSTQHARRTHGPAPANFLCQQPSTVCALALTRQDMHRRNATRAKAGCPSAPHGLRTLPHCSPSTATPEQLITQCDAEKKEKERKTYARFQACVKLMRCRASAVATTAASARRRVAITSAKEQRATAAATATPTSAATAATATNQEQQTHLCSHGRAPSPASQASKNACPPKPSRVHSWRPQGGATLPRCQQPHSASLPSPVSSSPPSPQHARLLLPVFALQRVQSSSSSSSSLSSGSGAPSRISLSSSEA